MISVTEALKIIKTEIQPTASKTVLLQEAFGAVLATDVFSPIDSPPFAQSAMDGYAVNFADVNETSGIEIQGVIPAGDTRNQILEKGKAFRIFTGAPIPKNADTVIIQEHIQVTDGRIFWDETLVKQGANIRGQASQLAKGDLAASRGTKLSPGAIGFLASLGVTHVGVFAQPKIGILVTGDELVKPGTVLKFGQIYESNGLTLQAALAEAGIFSTSTKKVADDEKATTDALRDLIAENDIVLISGGISVGDFDFVHQALVKNEVEQAFHKVLQKPGKPLYFGTKNNTLVFGLPGNPASVLTCFYVYVAPAIRKMRGQTFEASAENQKPVSASIPKKEHLTQFLKARLTPDGVALLGGQESYKMNAFNDADCFAIIPPGLGEVQKSELISTLDLSTVWA